MLSTLLSYLFGAEGSTSAIITLLAARIFVLLCCMPVHECAHAWMSDKLGDSTARLQGRITLNPFAHLTLLGTLMIIFLGFGYAKPVSCNIRNFKKRKEYFALTALAGPVSNLILGLFFALVYNIVVFAAVKTGNADTTIATVASTFFFYSGYINVVLAIFNLIPIPPLDGSRLLTLFLPDKIYYTLLQYERYFIYGLFILIYILNRVGFSPVSIITNYVYGFFNIITGLPFGV